jgi:hypothetical protein
MPFIRFSASKCCVYIIALILLLSKVISTYSYYTVKGLVYITIAALFS